MTSKIVYLTGAPASGKTTLATRLAEAAPVVVLSYGWVLSERLANVVRDQAELRQESSEVVTPRLVAEVDQLLIATAVECTSTGRHLVVDSHAVTKERYGFRCVPYSAAGLASVGFTHLVCLSASPAVVAGRIKAAAEGRPLPSLDELAMHNEMQRSLTLTYAHTLGVPAYILAADVDPVALLAGLRQLLSL